MTQQRQYGSKNRNGRRAAQPASTVAKMASMARPPMVRRAAEDVASMIFGVGFGAAIMYLLDPQSGRNRRNYLAGTARQRMSDAGAALAGRTRQAMDYASDELSHHMAEASHHAANAASGLRDTIPSTWRTRASNWIQPEHHYMAPAAGITAGGLALVALGAGVAYFFDPYRGRARRSVAGEYVRRAGQRVTHHSDEAPTEDVGHENVAENIESEPSVVHREVERNEI